MAFRFVPQSLSASRRASQAPVDICVFLINLIIAEAFDLCLFSQCPPDYCIYHYRLSTRILCLRLKILSSPHANMTSGAVISQTKCNVALCVFFARQQPGMARLKEVPALLGLLLQPLEI